MSAAALAEGTLSEDQVALIARHAPAYAEAEVADLAREATVSQLRRVLSKYTWRSDPPDPNDEPTPEPEPKRRTSLGYNDEGRWRLSAELPPDEGALVQRGFEATYQRLREAAESPEERDRITWSDALIDLALRSQGAPSEGPSRPMVLVHLRAEGAHLHLGPALPTTLSRYLGCDAWVRPVIDTGAVATSVGRALRIVPTRTRLAVEERDGAVGFPGAAPPGVCRSTIWCIGRRAGPPTPPISAPCARDAIACTTWACWASRATPMIRRAWSSPIP